MLIASAFACSAPASVDRGAPEGELHISANGFVLNSSESTRVGVIFHRGNTTYEKNGSHYVWPEDVAIRWRSSNQTAAEIDSDGLLSATNSAIAIVYVSAFGLSDSATVRTAPGEEPTLAESLALGATHACLLEKGFVSCWGSNWNGQLGQGVNVPYTATVSPTPIKFSAQATSVVSGGDYSCLLDETGTAFCWGSFGPAAPSTTATANTPSPISQPAPFVSVTIGGTHACGLGNSGKAYCWGSNTYGELGVGTPGNPSQSAQEVLVGGSLGFAAIAAGVRHTCALDTGGAAWCWGDNEFGQLGSGTNTASPVPVLVGGGVRFVSIASGLFHVCGIDPGRVAYCWGRNSSGEVGSGSNQSTVLIPTIVSGGLSWGSISPGGEHTCGVTVDNIGYCWGLNDKGQLGNSTNGPASPPSGFDTYQANRPVPVQGNLAFRVIEAGDEKTSCGVSTIGEAYCWGWDNQGQLGIGRILFERAYDTHSPVPVTTTPTRVRHNQ